MEEKADKMIIKMKNDDRIGWTIGILLLEPQRFAFCLERISSTVLS